MKIANKLESSINENTIEAVSGEELSEEEKENLKTGFSDLKKIVTKFEEML